MCIFEVVKLFFAMLKKCIDMSSKMLYLCTPKKTTPFLAKKCKVLLNIDCNNLISSALGKVLSESNVH